MPRYNYTISEKCRIIEDSEKFDVQQLAAKYKLATSSIYRILNNKDKILAANQIYNGKLTKISSKYTQLDLRLLKFVHECADTQVPISTMLLFCQANKLAKELGFEKQISIRWVASFRKRLNLKKKRLN